MFICRVLRRLRREHKAAVLFNKKKKTELAVKMCCSRINELTTNTKDVNIVEYNIITYKN